MSEQEGPAWRLLPLEQKLARRQGLPFKIPVPEEEYMSLADDGLKAESLERWIKDFLENAPVAKDGNWRRRNSEIISQLEGFIDKKPLWEKAQKLFADNEYEAAIKTLKRITIMMPEDHATRMNYASALANQGEYDKAYKQLKQIRDSFLGEPDYHLTVAQIHVARGDSDAAIGELVIALEHKPDHMGSMEALAKLGVLSSIYEDPKDAASLTYVRSDSLLDYLKERWDSEERSVAFYLEQLGYHESERRFEVALEAAERAVAKADGVEERAEIGRVSCLRELGRNDAALAAAKELVAKLAGSAPAHIELSKCLERAGQTDAAAQAIEAAVAADPGDQEALVLKFWPERSDDMMMDMQERMPALAAHAAAHPDLPGVWRSLARAKLVVRAEEEALELFEKAVGLAPGDDDLRSEWWGELAKALRYQDIVADSEKLDGMGGRDWKLRWNEAEAYRGVGRTMESRACFMQLNADETLHVDIRKRAKRAAMELGAPKTDEG